MLSKDKCAPFQVDDIAYGSIQEKRRYKSVPIAPFGNLHSYVPFYFAPKSPMLYVLTQTDKTGRQWPADELVYLVTSAQVVEQHGAKFVFTDGHAIMRFSQFFNKLADLDKVDWEVMQLQYWMDTEDDQDRERRRQAEFLVYDSVPLSLIKGIATKTPQRLSDVDMLQREYISDLPKIRTAVKTDFYY